MELKAMEMCIRDSLRALHTGGVVDHILGDIGEVNPQIFDAVFIGHRIIDSIGINADCFNKQYRIDQNLILKLPEDHGEEKFVGTGAGGLGIGAAGHNAFEEQVALGNVGGLIGVQHRGDLGGQLCFPVGAGLA